MFESVSNSSTGDSAAHAGAAASGNVANHLGSGQILGIWRLGDEISHPNDRGGCASRLFAAQPADAKGSPRYDYVIKTGTGESASTRQILATIAAADVQHPNLIATLDASASGTLPYVVMPRLDAVRLDQRIEDMTELTLPVALWMTRQIAQAAQAMHRSGWVHGDIKPANVLVDGRGHVTLIDLGFAARVHTPMASLFRGTPDYASPELIAGNTAALPAMDVFAIGKVLWGMLTQLADTDSVLLGAVAELIETMLDPLATDRRGSDAVVNELLSLELDSLGCHIGPAFQTSTVQRRAA